jgi:indolepyruvate ferredoxin oxidoreductase alpha subunit
MNKARGNEFAKKSVAVIGDSTFMHSGITGLVDIVYNNSPSTVCILDNSITGMTGHQNNPTTGQDIKGNAAPSVDLEQLCKGIGIKNIAVADPYDLEKFENIIKTEVRKT